MDEHLFIIKPSTISCAGRGLFTTIPIQEGIKVLEYKGRLQKYHSHQDHEYCFEIKPKFCINAKKNKGIAKYVNDNHGYKDKIYNLDWYIEGDKVYFISTRFIPKGSELFVDYGHLYWKMRQNNGIFY